MVDSMVSAKLSFGWHLCQLFIGFSKCCLGLEHMCGRGIPSSPGVSLAEGVVGVLASWL